MGARKSKAVLEPYTSFDVYPTEYIKRTQYQQSAPQLQQSFIAPPQTQFLPLPPPQTQFFVPSRRQPTLLPPPAPFTSVQQLPPVPFRQRASAVPLQPFPVQSRPKFRL